MRAFIAALIPLAPENNFQYTISMHALVPFYSFISNTEYTVTSQRGLSLKLSDLQSLYPNEGCVR